MRVRLLLMLLAVWLAAGAASAQTADAGNAEAIAHVLRSTWDRPDAAVDVGPVVTASGHAIAGWTQGDMGGRALLRKKGVAWIVVLCAGDELRNPDALRMAGLSDQSAATLLAALRIEESKISTARLAMFSRFEGLVAVDANTHHGHR